MIETNLSNPKKERGGSLKNKLLSVVGGTVGGILVIIINIVVTVVPLVIAGLLIRYFTTLKPSTSNQSTEALIDSEATIIANRKSLLVLALLKKQEFLVNLLIVLPMRYIKPWAGTIL